MSTETKESARSALSAIIAQAQKIIATDTNQYEPKTRVRWWNVAVAVLVLIGASSIIVPIVFPSTHDGLWGNAISEIWGIVATSIIAWIVYKRFTIERLHRATFSLFDPVRTIRQIALELLPDATSSGNTAPGWLTPKTKKRLHDLAELTFFKFSLYSRFLEVEDIAAIDSCASAALELSSCSDGFSAEGRYRLISNIAQIYLSSSQLLRTELSDIIMADITTARTEWSARWKQEISARFGPPA